MPRKAGTRATVGKAVDATDAVARSGAARSESGKKRGKRSNADKAAEAAAKELEHMKTLAEENPTLYGTAYLAMKDTIDKARGSQAAHTEDDQGTPPGRAEGASTPEDASAEKAAAGTDTVVAPAVGAATPAAKGTGATKKRSASDQPKGPRKKRSDAGQTNLKKQVDDAKKKLDDAKAKLFDQDKMDELLSVLTEAGKQLPATSSFHTFIDLMKTFTEDNSWKGVTTSDSRPVIQDVTQCLRMCADKILPDTKLLKRLSEEYEEKRLAYLKWLHEQTDEYGISATPGK